MAIHWRQSQHCSEQIENPGLTRLCRLGFTSLATRTGGSNDRFVFPSGTEVWFWQYPWGDWYDHGFSRIAVDRLPVTLIWYSMHYSNASDWETLLSVLAGFILRPILGSRYAFIISALDLGNGWSIIAMPNGWFLGGRIWICIEVGQNQHDNWRHPKS